MSTENQDKKLSLFLTIILGINIVVGSGVFAMPISLFRTAGASGLLSIICASICSLLIGLCFARVSYLIPGEGGMYSYAEAWGGKFSGLFASLIYLSGLTIALGLLAKILSTIISIYMIGVLIDHIAYSIIIFSFIANLFASSIARAGQIILFLLTIIPIFIICGICLSNFSNINLTPFFANGINGMLSGSTIVLFSLLGFEAISSMTRLVKHPEKNIPIATILTIVLVSILYLFFVYSVICGTSKELLLSKTTLSEILLYAFPSLTWIVHFINFAMMITIFGTMYSLQISLSELLISTIKKFTNNRVNLPEIFCILTISLLMTLSLKSFTNIDKTFSYVSILVVLAYLMVVLYLLIKSKSLYDKIFSIFGIGAIGVLMTSAVLQLF